MRWKRSRVPLGIAVLVTVIAPVMWGSSSSTEHLDAGAIIRKSVTANLADWQAQPKYSYREWYVRTKLKADEKPKVEENKTFEAMMIEGTPYERLVKLNNEPLSVQEEQQEQRKLNKEVQARQKESSKERHSRISKYQEERSEEHLLMQQMVDAFLFKLLGEEEVDGVSCYVLDASPKPNYHAPVEKARVLTGMQGKLWIAKNGFHWAKIQAHVTRAVPFGLFIAQVKPGTAFELRQAPVGGVWLPKYFSQSVNATVLGFYGMRSKEEEHYSDYHLNVLNADARHASTRR